MAALTQGATLTASAPEEDVLRANIVRVMLQTILRNDFVD